jgi:hypothetical protein
MGGIEDSHKSVAGIAVTLIHRPDQPARGISGDNGEERSDGRRPLLSRAELFLLRTPALFRAVRVDLGGYGVSWNDQIDLSEDELWTNGRPVPHGSRAVVCASHSSAS